MKIARETPKKVNNNGSNLICCGIYSDSTLLLCKGSTKSEFPQKGVPTPIIISCPIKPTNILAIANKNKGTQIAAGESCMCETCFRSPALWVRKVSKSSLVE